MRKSKLEIKNFRLLFCILYFAFLISAASAQSTNQSYPTAITSNEISGRIPARDIGDARLTNYFYAFNGNQGDVFINVQTSNFNGDIDVFTAGNLRPLTKITVYADDKTSETGRVVYLRQPAKLILRIQGRSPNDDAATFQIKFAGSFEPAQAVAENQAPELPEVKSESQTGVRVNSVGTIIEVKPKPTPAPKETIAKNEVKPKRKKTAAPENNKDTKEKEVAANESQPTKADAREIPAEEKTEAKTEENAVKGETEVERKTDSIAVKTDNAADDSAKTEAEKTSEESGEKTVGKTTRTGKRNSAANKARAPVKSNPKNAAVKVKEPNPLDNVHLIILLKDGTRIERVMSEVTKFAVDKGVLTVVARDGSINRYSILDVAKMTVE